MLELQLFGGADLQQEGGEMPRAAAHRHSLALLSLLATAPGRTHSRGKLVGLLWPDATEQAARNRLSTTVHRLRKALDDSVLISVGSGLRLNDERIRCDVWRFKSHLDRGEPEEAARLYRGPFLDGFWLRGSPEFEKWVELERDRLRSAYRHALEAVAEAAEAEERPKEAARWWRLRAQEDPYDSRVTMSLMAALHAAGNRPAALREFREHALLLKEELGSEPDEDIRLLARRIEQPPTPADPGGRDTKPQRGATVPSLAVLPFEHLGSSEEGRAFAAGLHHDLLTRLSRIDDLKVISRTSVLRYQGGGSVPEIARNLGVEAIVEGGIQLANGRVRLNVQLIEVRGDTHRWAQTYDHDLNATNLFDIQTELAEKIAGRLRAELTQDERARVGQRTTADLDAYLLYAQGRTHLARRTERGISRALHYFHRAVEEEPGYASAWAGVAEARALQQWYGYAVRPDAIDPMTAAERSVELGPELSEAYTALGSVYAGKQQGPAAIRAFQRAIILEPNNAEPHVWLGWMCMMLGSPEEGVPPAERGADLDPVAPYSRAFLSLLYLGSGRMEAALRESRTARKLQPEFEIPHFAEALALHHLGRFAESAFAAQECLPLIKDRGAPSRSEVQAALATTRAAAGDLSASRAILAEVRDAGDSFATGLIHAAHEDREQAFAAFERVRHWGAFSTLLVRHLFPDALGPLRGDPRFETLLRRVNSSWGMTADGALPEEERA